MEIVIRNNHGEIIAYNERTCETYTIEELHGMASRGDVAAQKAMGDYYHETSNDKRDDGRRRQTQMAVKSPAKKCSSVVSAAIVFLNYELVNTCGKEGGEYYGIRNLPLLYRLQMQHQRRIQGRLSERYVLLEQQQVDAMRELSGRIERIEIDKNGEEISKRLNSLTPRL